MNKSEKECDGCGERLIFKKLHKVIKEGKKVYFCSRCYNLNKQAHRNETIKESGIENEIRVLNNKIQKTYYKPTGNPRGRKPIEKEEKIKSKSIALALSLADKKVKEINEYLKDLGITLRKNRKLNEQDKDKIFKEELNKLYYS